MIITHRQDPHSFYEPSQPKTKSIHWDINHLDVDEKVISAIAHYTFDKSGLTYFDTSEINIIQITDSWGKKLGYELSEPLNVKGSRLAITVPANKQVIIQYKTAPMAKGLQWMTPYLAGGQPLIYTQGEAINARSYIPCQDIPSIKFTMTSTIRTPKAVRGLIAAAECKGRSAPDADGFCTESYAMPYPIPSYLIAFAVGNFESRELSHRSRVWALPSMVDACAREFVDIEKLMLIGEELFGPYSFGRQDFLVLPTAFPYGGMENPCLSFLTATLITGDGSGIGTLAHEMAHAWTGNLITNANWDAFWLNEGWTVWAEQKIMEKYRGRHHALVHYKLLECEFNADCVGYRKNGLWDLTKLAPAANDVDPDDIFSRVPYFKGSLLLMTIEQAVGRTRFAAFVAKYIDTFKFQSIYTETFLDFIVQELGQDVFNLVRVREWVYEPGLPSNAPVVKSTLIAEVQKTALAVQVPANDNGWTTEQCQLYLELLPHDVLTRDFMAQLDQTLGLRFEANIEVRASFLVAAIEADYIEVLPRVAAFLRTQGRMKYLRPLYRALAQTPEGKEFGLSVFAEARAGYHPVAISTIENVFKEESVQ